MRARYAQHFLINAHAIDRIVDALDLSSHHTVLEIGPGRGALTKLLLEKAKGVIAIEIDRLLIPNLKESFSSNPNFELIQKDFLKVDLPKKVHKVVGNLPYNVTSPILRRLQNWDGWNEAVVMVQKEVGERLCAKEGSKTYGALTVGMNLTCVMEPVFTLSENSFRPPPRVKSMVVKLTRRKRPLTLRVDQAQRVIQAAFQQRRKTLLNAISHGIGLTKEELEKQLLELKINPGIRAERLTVKQFVQISERLLS